jgi:ribosomal protein L29
MNITDIYVKPIEIYANKLDIALLKTALNDLMEKTVNSNDFYEVTNNIANLLTQLNEIGE